MTMLYAYIVLHSTINLLIIAMLPSQLIFLLSRHFRIKYDKNTFAALFLPDKMLRYTNQYYNPAVVHFPGGKKNTTWKNIFINNLAKKNITIQPANNIHIMQINNLNFIDKYNNPGEYFLNATDTKYNIAGKNISKHDWKNSLKILLLQEMLSKIPNSQKSQYFLFFDSTDAILLSSPTILINALNEYNCDILFGMDTLLYNGFSWPKNIIKNPDYIKKYKNDNFRFLNSGMIFGKVIAMQRLLNDLINEYKSFFPHKSDQHYYHTMRFNNTIKIGVDFKKKYLLNVFPFQSFFETKQNDRVEI